MAQVKTTAGVVEAVKVLRPFIGRGEMEAMIEGLRGEERTYFEAIFEQMAALVKAMPMTYQTEGQGDARMVYLHYFSPAGDWYIAEKDIDADGEGQIQAFGYARFEAMPDCAEWGYISIAELLANGVELDLHFAARTVAQFRIQEAKFAAA